MSGDKQMAANFTPGPWHVGGTFLPGSPDAHCSVWSAAPPGYQSGDQVAQYVHPKDANLIAAAPELLAALKALTDAPCSYAGSHIHIFCDSHADAMLRMREARAVIAKATGDTPDEAAA